MAHRVFFTIPEKQLFGEAIKIIVNRDTTQRKSTPEDARTKGKFGELHMSVKLALDGARVVHTNLHT